MHPYTVLTQAHRALTTILTPRTWGYLTYNPHNTNHWTSNKAIWRYPGDDDSILAEIEEFYHSRQLTARVEADRAVVNAATLQARGWEGDWSRYRIMHWPYVPQPHPTPPAGFTLNTATPDDVVELAQAAEDGTDWGYDWKITSLRYLLSHPTVTYYVARDSDTIAALLATFQHDGVALVDDVATRPAYRQRGLAAALLALAQAESPCDLYLEVEADNAQRIYERADFRVVATTEQGDWIKPLSSEVS